MSCAKKRARDSVCETANRHESKLRKCVRERSLVEGESRSTREPPHEYILASEKDQTLRPEKERARRGPRDNYATCDHRVRNQRRIDWKSLRRRAARFLAAATASLARSLPRCPHSLRRFIGISAIKIACASACSAWAIYEGHNFQEEEFERQIDGACTD